MKGTKPNIPRAIAQIHQQLKAKYPRRYALELMMRLRRRGVKTSRQQVYKFFNGAKGQQWKELLQAANEMLI